MGKEKLKHFERREMVSDAVWEQAMEVSVKYIAKKLKGLMEGGAFDERVFGEPAPEHFVLGAFEKLYAGEWEWCEHRAVHTQIIRIALSDIHHHAENWKKQSHADVVEIDEQLAERLKDDEDFMDIVYEIAEEVAAGDKDLLDYLAAMRKCDDYELIGEELGISIREVYQRQRKLMRRLKKKISRT